MSWAAPMSSDTARMALPIFVRFTSTVSSAMLTMATARVTRVVREIFRLPRLKLTVGMMAVLGKLRGLAERSSWATFSRKKETPMAVISREILGAFRKGA